MSDRRTSVCRAGGTLKGPGHKLQSFRNSQQRLIMRRRSYNSKLALLTVVIAVILGTLLTRLDSAQQRAEPQERKSATGEFNKLSVDGVRKPPINEGAHSATATAPNRLFTDSGGAKQPGDLRSRLGARMQTHSL